MLAIEMGGLRYRDDGVPETDGAVEKDRRNGVKSPKGSEGAGSR